MEVTVMAREADAYRYELRATDDGEWHETVQFADPVGLDFPPNVEFRNVTPLVEADDAE